MEKACIDSCFDYIEIIGNRKENIMFESTKEFDSSIKDVLKMVRDGENLDSISSKLNMDAADFGDVIVECDNRGFLSGVSYRRTGDGIPRFSPNKIRITYSGLDFIEPDN